MHASKHARHAASLHSQRGVTLMGLILVLGVVIGIAMLALKVFPTFLEYRAIKSAVVAAKGGSESVREIQDAFDRAANINSIETINGKDLIISKDTGQTEISFDYEKKIPLFTDVTLVIHYSGTTDKRGIIPERPAEPIQ